VGACLVLGDNNLTSCWHLIVVTANGSHGCGSCCRGSGDYPACCLVGFGLDWCTLRIGFGITDGGYILGAVRGAVQLAAPIRGVVGIRLYLWLEGTIAFFVARAE
jgi:hypothetical protein